MKESSFRKQIENLINTNCIEDASNTPDFVLAEYLIDCLRAFDNATNKRELWYQNKKDYERRLG